ARSAYKLQELDEKYDIIKPNSVIVDCGASPGSWSQYTSRKLFPNAGFLEIEETQNDGSRNSGLIVAIDLFHIEPIAGVNTIQGDFTEAKTQENIRNLLEEREVDVVLSDLAPKFTGIHFVDHTRSMELCESSFSFAQQVLKPGGAYLCKFIMGGTELEFRNILKTMFEIVRHEKPQASHKESTEGYYVCLGYKETPN
ncbi:13608_t:CDS:2, partial [Acaulospora colombiana]